MGIFRTILWIFRARNKYPKIFRLWFSLIIRHLVKYLKTRVFETE